MSRNLEIISGYEYGLWVNFPNTFFLLQKGIVTFANGFYNYGCNTDLDP